MSSNEQKLDFIIIILVILAVMIFSFLFIFLSEDESIRYDSVENESSDCPYKHELKISDLNLESTFDSRNYSDAKIKVEVSTGHDSIRVNGNVEVETNCNFNYCFESICQWNYSAHGKKTLNFEDSSFEYAFIDVSVYGAPNSIYNRLNDISCKTSILKVDGELLIYGEKVN